MNPHPSGSPAPSARWAWALGLIVVGARLSVLAYAGSPVPFYDQWLAEYNNLLLPIAGGQGFSTLFERHNEHVLLTTRILTLVGYLANGYWDVTFLSVCSAMVRAFTAAFTFHLISDGASERARLALWSLCVIAFALPLSGYNLLSGLQVSFYLTDLALLGSVYATLRWSSPAAGVIALVLGTLAGVLSMASGVLIPLATLGAHFGRPRDRRGFWLAGTLSVVVAAAYLIPFVTDGSAVRLAAGSSPADRLGFLGRLLAWPQASPLFGAALAGAVAWVTWTGWQSRRRDAAFGATLALGLYAGAGAALLASNRDPASFHPRHWDAIGLLPLAALALAIRHADAAVTGARVVAALTSLIGASYVIGVVGLSLNVCRPYLQESRAGKETTLAHYRALLINEPRLRAEASRLNSQLEQRDYRFFDEPIGRHALHPIVVHNLLAYRPLAHTLLAPEILPIRPPATAARILAVVRDGGWLALPAGFLLMFTALAADRRAPKPVSAV